MGESDPDKFIPHPTDMHGHRFPCVPLGDEHVGSLCQGPHCPPVEPLEEGDVTPLREMALHAHTLYEEFQAAGFDESQALYAAMCLMCGGPRCPGT